MFTSDRFLCNRPGVVEFLASKPFNIERKLPVLEIAKYPCWSDQERVGLPGEFTACHLKNQCKQATEYNGAVSAYRYASQAVAYWP